MALSIASGGYIQTPGVATSLSFLMRTTQVTANIGVAQQADAAASFKGFTMYMNNTAGKLTVDCKNAGASVGLAAGATTVNDGNWHHVGLVVAYGSGNTQRLYVDGVLDASWNVSGVWGGTTNGFRLGRTWDTFWGAFVGDVAELAVWGVALSADDMAALGKRFRPRSIRIDPQSGYYQYAPLIRGADEVTEKVTSTSSVSVADHPRIY